MVLAFGQLLITYVYLGFVPYAYLVHASRSDEQVRQNLEDLDSYVSTHPDSQVSAPQLFEERPELVAGLVSAIPWALIVLLGSCLIFPAQKRKAPLRGEVSEGLLYQRRNNLFI